MPAWLADAEIKPELAADLKKAGANAALVASYIDRIIAWANKRAKVQIRGYWLSQGYTLTQIESDWDEETRQALHLSQSLYWIDVRLLQLFQDTESEHHKLKDVMPELATLTLLNAGGDVIELPTDADTSGRSGTLAVCSTRTRGTSVWTGRTVTGGGGLNCCG